MSPGDISLALSELIVSVEGKFTCQVGPAQAYFEYGVPPDTKRGVYEVLKLGALLKELDSKEESAWAKDLSNCALSLFDSLKLSGATRIFWRLGQRIEMKTEHRCAQGGDVLLLYTRFAALTPDGQQIYLQRVCPGYPEQGMEGQPPIYMTREQLGDGRP